MSTFDDLIAQSDDEMLKAHRMQDSDTAALVSAIDALRLVILAGVSYPDA